MLAAFSAELLQRQRVVAVCLVLVLSGGVPLQAQSLFWIAPPASGGSIVAADLAVVGEMPVVVGQATFVDPQRGIYIRRAFIWTPSNGLRQLGALDPSMENGASAISPDGRYIVGVEGNRAVLWTLRGDSYTIQDLGVPTGYSNSKALDVSHSGAVLIRADDPGSALFRWTPGGNIQLIASPVGEMGAISADGEIVVGGVGGNAPYAFRWSGSGGLENLNAYLPPPAPPTWLAEATAMSPDGRFIVGNGFNGQAARPESFLMDYSTKAVRWMGIPASQDVTLYVTSAQDVSSDGTIVVGFAVDHSWSVARAVWWRQDTGPEDLNRRFSSLLQDGSVLREARAISPDGRYIVGIGFHAARNQTEVFVLDTRTATAVNSEKLFTRFLEIFPNPVSAEANIRFALEKSAPVQLEIFSSTGARVYARDLGWLAAGEHQVRWDGRSVSGMRLAAGLYLCRLLLGGEMRTATCILLP